MCLARFGEDREDAEVETVVRHEVGERDAEDTGDEGHVRAHPVGDVGDQPLGHVVDHAGALEDAGEDGGGEDHAGDVEDVLGVGAEAGLLVRHVGKLTVSASAAPSRKRTGIGSHSMIMAVSSVTVRSALNQ